MRKLFNLGLAIVASSAALSSFAMSLADASAKIDEAVADSSKMTSLIRELSPEDQVTFLSRVNAAINVLPGSMVEKVSNFLKANRAAMKGAAKGNLTKLLSETFATCPPEALTLINERFAAELFNRAANPLNPITDEMMVAIATETMKEIRSRNAKSDNSEVRNTFALLMFVRASNGTPADLRDKLLEMYPTTDAREIANKEWIPPALAENQAKSYELLLAACDAGEQPDLQHAMMLAGPETMFALLSSLEVSGASKMASSVAHRVSFHGIENLMGDDSGLDRVPRTSNRSAKFWGGYRRGKPGGGETVEYPDPDAPPQPWNPPHPPVEPDPYANQGI